MSVFVMKLIAMASMLCDHAAVFLYPFHFISHPAYVYMRAVGRVAFPIFAFLIVNGYEKTRDVKRYLTRLIAFAAISQIPYVLTCRWRCGPSPPPSFTCRGAAALILAPGLLPRRLAQTSSPSGLAQQAAACPSSASAAAELCQKGLP